jgi:ATPase related to the helicase subunit of the Holliday junction resolvase
VDENLYYDLISAFIKSMRGSDPDAALYYSARLINAGCDPMLIARRIMLHAAEDVGLADPNALNVAASACYAFEKTGLPEGRIPLSEAIIYISLAPKSNSVVTAMGGAYEAAEEGKDERVPHYLRDQSYAPVKDTSYKYPHDFGGWVEQQYLPDEFKDRRFLFSVGERERERRYY